MKFFLINLLSCLVLTITGVNVGTEGERILCEVDDSGIMQAHGKVLASITADQVIKSPDGTRLGMLKNGAVYNHKNQPVGIFTASGDVFDARKKRLGSIGNDRIVRDASGKTIGYAMRTPREWAIVAYFFIYGKVEKNQEPDSVSIN